MAQWQFCEECGRCYLEMSKNGNGKFCSNECAKKTSLRNMKEWRAKRREQTAVLAQIAYELLRKRWRALTPDAIEELRIQADRLIDYCDELEGIPHD